MKQISLSELRKFTVEELKAILPVMVTADSMAFAYLAGLDDIIVLSDLHPRMRNSLKMQEQRARAGMPPEEKLTKAEV